VGGIALNLAKWQALTEGRQPRTFSRDSGRAVADGSSRYS